MHPFHWVGVNKRFSHANIIGKGEAFHGLLRHHIDIVVLKNATRIITSEFRMVFHALSYGGVNFAPP